MIVPDVDVEPPELIEDTLLLLTFFPEELALLSYQYIAREQPFDWANELPLGACNFAVAVILVVLFVVF